MKKYNKKILITGSSGLIGKQIICHFKEYIVLSPSHAELDITDEKKLNEYFYFHRPDIVIHLAAFRNATEAENQRGDKHGEAWRTNVDGTYNIAQACKKNNAYLIFTSSNYIFSGMSDHPSPYTEHETAEPDDEKISWYGITKKHAEKIILETNPQSAIIRISNPAFSINLETEDYVGKLYWLIKRNMPLFIDQIVSLTDGINLIKSLRKLVSHMNTGIFHISTADTATPHLIGQKLLELLNEEDNKIERSEISLYLEKHPLRYPKYGALDSKYTQKILGIRYPKIQKVLYNLVSGYKTQTGKD